MGRRDAFAFQKFSQGVGKFEHRFAGSEITHPDAVPVGGRFDTRAERLGERLFGGEALGEVVGRQAVLLEPLELARAENPPGKALAVALERRLNAADFHHVGADAVDHRAARTISCFISRTASRMPTNTARLTMACPMCSSRTPVSAATGWTLK